LFWKKKTKPQLLVAYESDETRSSFRVRPLSTEPIRVSFQGKSVLVENIGASGMAFRNQDFRTKQSETISIHLPGEGAVLSIEAQIVEIDKDGLCHCRFIGLDEDASNAIHRYLLAVQVRQARMKREAQGTAEADARPFPAIPDHREQQGLLFAPDGPKGYV